MRSQLTRTAALALLASGLSACAGGDHSYPSLAIRPVETGGQTEAPPPAPIRAVVPFTRLTELRGTAAAADEAFAARADDAARLARAAAGQPFESNARAAALVALAELDTHRGKTAGALAALDALAAEAAGALSPDPALVSAQSEVAAVLAREDARIARLWEVMGS
jgi:hypothetical protein